MGIGGLTVGIRMSVIVRRPRPTFMRYFPPDELITKLTKNFAFTIANNANDNTDLAMFQMTGAIKGGTSDLTAIAGGTTGISAVALETDIPRLWDEWVKHYQHYMTTNIYIEIEIQVAASDTTGSLWIYWWITAAASTNMPDPGFSLAGGNFDNDDPNWTGTGQASTILANARGIRKMRTYRADAKGGRRVIRVNMSPFQGPHGEWAPRYVDSAEGFQSNATVIAIAGETTQPGVIPVLHVALVNQAHTTTHISADIFVKKVYTVHFMDRTIQDEIQGA